MVKETEEENYNGKMVLFMKGISNKIIVKETVSCILLMVQNIRESLRITILMVMVK